LNERLAVAAGLNKLYGKHNLINRQPAILQSFGDTAQAHVTNPTSGARTLSVLHGLLSPRGLATFGEKARRQGAC
jgi:hypothetical protein